MSNSPLAMKSEMIKPPSRRDRKEKLKISFLGVFGGLAVKILFFV
jgi:hypothetical protein